MNPSTRSSYPEESEGQGKLLQFHFGMWGAACAVVTLLVGMVIATFGGGRIEGLCAAVALGLFVSLALVKDRCSFGSVIVKGMGSPLLGTLLITFLFAGILSKLMMATGLVDALLGIAGLIGMPIFLLPAVSFVLTALVSLACGTSAGAISALTPLLVPLAASAGCSVMMTCGAIIGGALFGNALSPVSDVVVAASVSYRQPVDRIISANAVLAGAAAIATLAIMCFASLHVQGAGETVISSGEIDYFSLTALLLPASIIALIKRGWGLVSSLMACDILGMALVAFSNSMGVSELIASDGLIATGLSDMRWIAVYSILLFAYMEVIVQSGILGCLSDFVLRRCHSSSLVNEVCVLFGVVGSILSGGSSPAVIMFGSVSLQLASGVGVKLDRAASLLTQSSIVFSGLLPYGTPCLLCLQIVNASLGGSFTYGELLPCLVYCLAGLLITVVFAALPNRSVR